MFFKTPHSEPHPFGGEIILKNLANLDYSDSRLEEYRNPLKKAKIHSSQIPSDRLLLGTTDDDYTIPATIPYNRKSFGAIIVAHRGAGKTQFIKHLAFSQLYERFGYNLFIVDPKDDYKNVGAATKEAEFVERMTRFGIKPHGFRASYFKPAFANMTDRRGTEYIVTLKDFKALEYGKRAEAITDFFYDDDMSPAAKAAIEVVLQKAVPESIKSLENHLRQYKINLIKERQDLAKEAGASSASKMVSSKADQIIARKIQMGYLGDDGQKITREVEERNGKFVITKSIKASAINFPEELALGGGPNVVVLQSDLTASRAHIFSCYIKIAIARIWDDRWKYYTTDGREGVMARPTFVITDEADTLLPKEKIRYSPSREQFNQLLSKGRQCGWGAICVTQQPWMISSEFIDHVDYVIGTAVDEKMGALLKSKFSYDDNIIEDLKKLKRAKANQMPEWFCASRNEEEPIVTFFAIPPQIAMVKEKAPMDF